jgi:hypothetical protein
MAERTTAGERGSVLPLVAVWLAVAVLAMMAIMAAVGAGVDRARAQAAADAAALAGAADGRAAAELVAAENGGSLERYSEVAQFGGGESNHPGRLGRNTYPAVVVTVVVHVDGAMATASAERFLAQLESP